MNKTLSTAIVVLGGTCGVACVGRLNRERSDPAALAAAEASKEYEGDLNAAKNCPMHARYGRSESGHAGCRDLEGLEFQQQPNRRKS